MSSAAMAGTETGQELAAQTGYGGAGWAGPSGVGGEPVAGSVALTGENPISSGWIGMVGSGIGLSTKALNKALHKGKACIRALKPWIRALKPWIMHLFSQASLPGIQALKRGKALKRA